MRQEHTPRHIRKLSTKYQENTCKTSAPMVSFPIHKVWEPKGTQTFLALFWACSQEASHPLLTTTWGLQILPRCYKISSEQKRVALGLVYLRILLLLCLICTSLYTSVWKRFRHPTISGGERKQNKAIAYFIHQFHLSTDEWDLSNWTGMTMQGPVPWWNPFSTTQERYPLILL